MGETTVWVSACCPRCGPVDYRASDITAYPAAGRYVFACRLCEGIVSERLTEHCSALLTAAGALTEALSTIDLTEQPEPAQPGRPEAAA